MASNPQSGTEKEPQSASASASGTGTGTGTGATPTPSFASINIKNNTINEAEGVKLSEHQKVLVGSTLDIFEGNPTLKHFSLWSPTATFDDPLTKAEGEAHYKAQWYGLVSLFHPIRIQSHRVTSSKNPIEFELSNKYTVRGIGKEQVIDSVVSIHVGEDGKIERLVDRWGGRLPFFYRTSTLDVPQAKRRNGPDVRDRAQDGGGGHEAEGCAGQGECAECYIKCMSTKAERRVMA